MENTKTHNRSASWLKAVLSLVFAATVSLAAFAHPRPSMAPRPPMHYRHHHYHAAPHRPPFARPYPVHGFHHHRRHVGDAVAFGVGVALGAAAAVVAPPPPPPPSVVVVAAPTVAAAAAPAVVARQPVRVWVEGRFLPNGVYVPGHWEWR